MLPVLVSPGVLVVPVNGPGDVPTVLALGVDWHLDRVADTGIERARRGAGDGLTTGGTTPGPPSLKLAGALTPAGSVIVVVIGPVVGPLPLLVTVIGTLLATPATKLGEG